MPDYCSEEQRQRIVQLLRARERSVSWLARQLSMNESLLHHILRARRRAPVGFWPRVAGALDVALEALLVEKPAA